jgi:hypothetical protein
LEENLNHLVCKECLGGGKFDDIENQKINEPFGLVLEL